MLLLLLQLLLLLLPLPLLLLLLLQYCYFFYYYDYDYDYVYDDDYNYFEDDYDDDYYQHKATRRRGNTSITSKSSMTTAKSREFHSLGLKIEVSAGPPRSKPRIVTRHVFAGDHRTSIGQT